MILSNEMCKVIAELEYLIGSECYNPNSYDGWNDVEGCDYRYPINVPNPDGEYTKVRGKINESYLIDASDITPQTIPFIKYRFGSNELFIGKGLISILSFLEERYGIDFSELEKEAQRGE